MFSFVNSTFVSQNFTMQMSENYRMSPQSKFTCGCCSDNPEGANSDEVIFQYFGKEFTEYEYIVENLAIRPAPKKLLDLVPVHSTNIKFNSNSSSSGIQSSSNDSMTMANKQPISGAEGDVCRAQADVVKIRDSKDFISFKTPRPEERKQIGRFAPCPYPEHPLTQPSRPAKNYAEFRQRIINKDYRSKTIDNKQVLSDLCRTSEASLNIKSRKHSNENNDGPVPKDIQDTIESLSLKKAKMDFHRRNENHLFQIPQVYCLNVKRKKQSSDEIIDTLDLDEKKPSHDSLIFNIDSMAQTEISKGSPCPKKDKKSLKWKIIINKHTKS